MNINLPNVASRKDPMVSRFFMVSGSKHLSSANNRNKSLDFFCSCAGGMKICKSDSTLYKDADEKCMDNYRPISVLPVASKILEKAVQIQLLQHSDNSSQLSPFQWGFRKNILPRTRLHISGIVLGNALTKVVLRQRCLSTFEKHSTVKITNFF